MTITATDSVRLLVAAQTAQGAIPASTVHDIYQYGWLRDGSWCAYALDRTGHAESASRWHHWVARTVIAHQARVEQALAAVRSAAVNGRIMMPARFTLDGHEEHHGENAEEWPNFQTDCYGFWLWALADHIGRGGRLDETLTEAARIVIRYLIQAGDMPCYDCWEEHPGHVHTSSLAAVAAGLRDAGALLDDAGAQQRASELVARITGPDHVLADAFVRFPADTRVDGSLLWLAIPFGVVDLTDTTYRNTLTRIRDELVIPGGGVRRYLGDTFYGGSEWILLAASYARGVPRPRRSRHRHGHARLDREHRHDRRAPPRTGPGPRPVPVHAGVLEAQVGRHRHPTAVVTRHARPARGRAARLTNPALRRVPHPTS